MDDKIVRYSKDLITNTWAGGTTTELFIFPAEAQYKQFNFDFRLSYATVEVEESAFTFMPGVTRHLLILEGAIDLFHESSDPVKLNRFQSHVFNGETPTKAKGKVTDFNLMVRNGFAGKLDGYLIDAGNNIGFNSEAAHIGLFLWKGRMNISNGDQKAQLNKKDFVLLPNSANLLSVVADIPSEFVVAQIFSK